jgi:hypothetical protein
MIHETDPVTANLRTDLDELFIVDGDQSKPLRDWTADDFSTWADHEESRFRFLAKLARDRATGAIAKLERLHARTVGEMIQIQHEGRA